MSLCKKGLHDLADPQNVRVKPDGRVRCRLCALAAARARRAELRELLSDQRSRAAEAEAAEAVAARAAFIEDLAFMAATGETTEGAAERIGISADSLHKRLTAKDRLIVRPDLWEALRRNEIRKYGVTLAQLRQERTKEYHAPWAAPRRRSAA